MQVDRTNHNAKLIEQKQSGVTFDTPVKIASSHPDYMNWSVNWNIAHELDNQK